jgi:hypothetical protein
MNLLQLFSNCTEPDQAIATLRRAVVGVDPNAGAFHAVALARRCYADLMVRREIDIDDETDRSLIELAQNYEGDFGKALADLIHSRERMEAFVDECEEFHRDSLLAQVERAERGFARGRFTSWQEVKRQNSL